MSIFHSNAGIVMDMVIFPKHVRRKQKRKVTKRRENNGLKHKRTIHKTRSINQKEKEEKWGRTTIPPDRSRMKLRHL